MKIIESKEEYSELLNNNELVFVDFYADWCGPCKRLAPLLEELKEIDVLKVNVDLFDSLSRSYGIMSIPTLILFENGKEIKKIIGFQTEAEIKEFIK